MSSWPKKLDHMGLPVRDLAISQAFYAAALQPIGFSVLSASDAHVSFGIAPMPYFTLHKADAVAGSVHVAFLAESRSQVDAFHAAALEAGGRDHGGPGLRPDYHPDYYGAFVLDPDGHNIEVVKHAAE